MKRVWKQIIGIKNIQWTCTQCGCWNESGRWFCGNCGKLIDDTDKEGFID